MQTESLQSHNDSKWNKVVKTSCSKLPFGKFHIFLLTPSGILFNSRNLDENPDDICPNKYKFKGMNRFQIFLQAVFPDY